jgi:hypothetical protein
MRARACRSRKPLNHWEYTTVWRISIMVQLYLMGYTQARETFAPSGGERSAFQCANHERLEEPKATELGGK